MFFYCFKNGLHNSGKYIPNYLYPDSIYLRIVLLISNFRQTSKWRAECRCESRVQVWEQCAGVRAECKYVKFRHLKIFDFMYRRWWRCGVLSNSSGCHILDSFVSSCSFTLFSASSYSWSKYNGGYARCK